MTNRPAYRTQSRLRAFEDKKLEEESVIMHRESHRSASGEDTKYFAATAFD